MADKYDKNGYNSSDFKRNAGLETAEQHHEQDGHEVSKLNEKAGEYIRELLSEKIKLNSSKFPISARLLDSEVTKVQATGKFQVKDNKYIDVYNERHVKVVVKVLVPSKIHPKVNFIGKLMGPKGSTMKQLQDETMCKMAVLGRGSMRDREKEEELRNSFDPRHAHLSDELHVEITALAPPAEAHARIAYALAEVKKYLIPDPNDMIRQPMRDFMEREGPPQHAPRHHHGHLHPQHSHPRTQLNHPPVSRMPPQQLRHPKTKVLSILDRARSALEIPYSYENPYDTAETSVRQGPRGHHAPEPDYEYEREQERFYEDDDYYKEEVRDYKTSTRDVGTRRAGPGPSHARHYSRASPYARPPK